MKLFSAFQYILSQVGSFVLGMDKESFDSRIQEVKRLGYEGCAKIAKELKGTDQALAYQATQMWSDVINKSCTNLFIYLDWCSSGASLLSALTRCEEGMKSCGVFNEHKPGNLYQEITELLNRQLGTNLTRKEVKSFTVPFYYGGDANVRWALGEDNVGTFHKVYSTLLPGAYDFRNKGVDAWDESKDEYSWTMPDGYQVAVPVLSDSELVTVDFNGGSYKCHFKVKAPRPTYIETSQNNYIRNHKTKGLGAHVIHSTDALVLREMVGMAHMPRYKAEAILRQTKKGYDADMAEDRTLEHLLLAWENTNMPSVRWFYELSQFENAVTLPYELYNQLAELATKLDDMEFDMITIHDEFGCLPSHVNSMRKYANTVYANIYRSNLMDYFNRTLNMDVKIGEFKQEIYDRLLEVDYLLS